MKRLIITGGTIDKEYIPETGRLEFTNTKVPYMIEQARIDPSEVSYELLMQIDSNEMTDEDRWLIAKACRRALETSIIITHGTDTMPETARFLQENTARDIGEKTIVLTGAMAPFTVKSSDALFNLGSAFAHVDMLPPGVYISMNGKAFEANNVQKNKQLGRFEPIN